MKNFKSQTIKVHLYLINGRKLAQSSCLVFTVNNKLTDKGRKIDDEFKRKGIKLREGRPPSSVISIVWNESARS